jgi:hypothetical protein
MMSLESLLIGEATNRKGPVTVTGPSFISTPWILPGNNGHEMYRVIQSIGISCTMFIRNPLALIWKSCIFFVDSNNPLLD